MRIILLCLLCLNFQFGFSKKNLNPKIALAITDTSGNGYIKEGVELALEEVNKRGLPQGKTLQLVFKENKNSINEALINAANIVKEGDIIAAIGNSSSTTSIATSSVFEFNDILMLNPYSTAQELTQNGYQNIFRVIPSDNEFGRTISQYFISQGYTKPVVCYISSAYGMSFANSFEKDMESKGFDIIDRISYEIGNTREFNKILKNWENYDFDSILFVGLLPEGENFLKRLKEKGINKPIICSDGMLDIELDKADHVAFPAIFDPEDSKSNVRNFIKSFKQKFGKDPDAFAALGYDSVYLIAQSIIDSKSYEPEKMRKALKSLKNFAGVVNKYNFSESGELISTNLGMQVAENGQMKQLGKF